MYFEDAQHSASLLQQLKLQQESSELCDVTLQVDGGHLLKAHRAVLAAGSCYFRTLLTSNFKDRENAVLTIPGCSFETMQLVLTFIYTGTIDLSLQHVEGVLKVANFLCLSKLKDYCGQALRDQDALSEENCMSVKFLADHYDLKELAQVVMEFIAPRFERLIQSSSALLEMPFEFVHRLVTDRRLNYVRESLLADFVIKWARYDSAERATAFQKLWDELQLEYLPEAYVKDVLLQNGFVTEILSERCLTDLQTIAQRNEIRLGGLEDVIICRSRSVKSGDQVQLLCYVIREAKWLLFRSGDGPRSWNGLESMTLHNGSLYLLVSQPIDMCGYMHNPPAEKLLYKADFRTSSSWELLSGPGSVRGECRLISHVNGLYVIDRYGRIEEYDPASSTWCVSDTTFEDCPNATMCLLPMPADRYIYILRGFADGHGFKYAQMSYSLHCFDTVRQSWECLSQSDSGDLDLEDHERFHSYCVSPGQISLRNEIGQRRVVYDTVNREWSSTKPKEVLPSHVGEVWGSVAHWDRVYFAGQSKNDSPSPIFMMFDHGRKRMKDAGPPPMPISGLLCHLKLQSHVLAQMTTPCDCP